MFDFKLVDNNLGGLDYLASCIPFIMACIVVYHDHYNKKRSGLKKITTTGRLIMLSSLILVFVSLLLTSQATKNKKMTG